MKTAEIKVGDFIKGAYKFGCIHGVVTTVKKNIVVVEKHNQWYNEYTPTGEWINVTKGRISQVGLADGETIK